MTETLAAMQRGEQESADIKADLKKGAMEEEKASKGMAPLTEPPLNHKNTETYQVEKDALGSGNNVEKKASAEYAHQNGKENEHLQHTQTTAPYEGSKPEAKAGDSQLWRSSSRALLAEETGYTTQSGPLKGESSTRIDYEAFNDPEQMQHVIADRYEEPGRRKSGSRRLSLARIKREELLAKISAWEEAKISELNNRYKRDEAKIIAMEDHEKAKASITLKKTELRLEQERAKAVEKMENEFAWAHKKAEERKAAAFAEKEAKVTLLYEEAERIKITRRIPSNSCFSGFM